MTSISLANYYPLSGTQSASSNTSNSNSLSGPQSLVNDLNSVENNTSGTTGTSAYSLSLSPAAQMLLGTGTSSTSSSFTLTSSQQSTISNILEKYKDAPFTQATFDSIQNDLQSAGLSPDQMIAKDETSSFSSTDSLISALNGNYNVTSSGTTIANEQTKASNYLQSIVKEWQSISTTSSGADATSTNV